MRRILAFGILLFMFSICTVIVQDRAILVSLWQMSPVLHSFAYSVGDVLVLVGIGALLYARRAFAVAYDPDLKESIQQIIDRLCP